MKILCITHADFETPDIIGDWAKQRDYSFTICKPHQGENCLNMSSFDFLIVMDGPRSPLEIETDPYLKEEIALITQATQGHKIILDFCLGVQFIREARKGKTEHNTEKEVGLYPLTLTEERSCDPLLKGFPNSFPAIHWHNDILGEIKDSVILAYSKGCP